jgi:subtilisin family serine protease
MSLVLGKKRKLGGYKRVKIAILDTGFDWVHPNWIYVKDNYKDFVDEKNNDDEYKVGVDKTGHGTNGVHLLFKIMPHADICVARVFDTNEATNETPTLVAKVCLLLTDCRSNSLWSL